VSDESGRPIPKAQISIPRQGRNASSQTLKEVKDETNAQGEYTRPLTDFQLTGTPHKIIVTAGDLKEEQALSDQQLRDAVSKGKGVLVVQVSLKPQRKSQRLVISGTVTDHVGQPILEAVISLSKAPGDPATEATTQSGADGRFELPAIEFRPEDAPHNLKVLASGFQDFEISLTNEELGKSSNNTLRLNPIRLVPQLSVFQQFKNGLDWLLWSFGLLSVLVLGTYLGYRTYRRLTPTPPRLSTRYLVEKIYLEQREIKNSMLTEAALGPVLTQSLKAWYDEEKSKQDSNNKQKGENSTTMERGSTPTKRDSVTARDGSQSIVPQVEVVRDPQSMAQKAYQNLLNKIPVDREPVYLDVEGPRLAAGKLEDKTVYLTQVNHSNAALVLFTANNSAGWLFPNPKLAFSTAAIKDVFLELTETEYQARKFELEPRPAVRVDDCRWKVATN